MSHIQCPKCKVSRHHSEFKSSSGHCSCCAKGMGIYAVMPNSYYMSQTGSGGRSGGGYTPTQNTPSSNIQNIDLTPNV